MNNFDPYEYDKAKTRVLKYVVYQRRTKKEVLTKFEKEISYDMLCDIISFLETEKYLNDKAFVKAKFENAMAVKTNSIYELSQKILAKGVSKEDIEDYVYENKEILNEYEKQCIRKIALKNMCKGVDYLKQYLFRKGYIKDNVNVVLNEELEIK